MRKRFYVDGLLEWQVIIPAGKIDIPVFFEGGRISGYGITPAEFITSDPVLQRAIESSSYFRSGRIKMMVISNSGTPLPDLPPSQQQIVDVPDLNSARQQLARLTNTPLNQLVTKAAVESCAKQHGIILKISKK